MARPNIVEILLKVSVILLSILLIALAAIFQEVLPEGFARKVVPVVLSELGAVLLALALMHLAYEKFLRDQWLKVNSDFLKKELSSYSTILEQNLKGYTSAVQAGMLRYYSNIPTERIEKMILSAKEVRILKTFFQEEPRYEKALEEALEQGKTKVELFLCNPDSPVLAKRCKTIKVNPESVRDRLIHAVELMEPFAGEDPSNTQVRVTLYSSWPGQPLFVFDDVIFLGLYLRKVKSFDGPWVEINRKYKLGKVLLRQLEFPPENGRECLRTRAQFQKWLARQGITKGRVASGPLFSGVTINALKLQHQQLATDDVNSLSSRLLQEDSAEFASRIIADLTLELPGIDESLIYRERKGVEILFHVPFGGDFSLFEVKPSQQAAEPPSGQVDAKKSEVLLTYLKEGSSTPVDVECKCQQTVREIKQHLDCLRPDIDGHGKWLREYVFQQIAMRKETAKAIHFC